MLDISLKKVCSLVFDGYAHESWCKWKLTSWAFRKCILCLGSEQENIPKKMSKVQKCGKNAVFGVEFWFFSEKSSKNCQKIWNISNSTPLLQKTLCALIELYVRNILILNWRGNPNFYKSDFYFWHTSTFSKKQGLFENVEVCQK